MSQPILSHTFPNGLVLVAEPMGWLQSAAFTFLAPAGCVLDPAARSGLSSFTCEMLLRGAGERDGRQFILDLDGLGVERHEAVSNAHATYSGATVAENLPAALAIYADLLRRPHLPAEQLEVVPPGGVAGPAGGRGRAGGKGDDRVAAEPLSAFPGAARHRASKRPWRPPR